MHSVSKNKEPKYCMLQGRSHPEKYKALLSLDYPLSMHILAFETSCDDTSLALFRDDSLLSLVTRSQIREHAATG